MSLLQRFTECDEFHEAENSRQSERHRKTIDVQILWSLCAQCVEFLSQRRSGAVSMESRHGEEQDLIMMLSRKGSFLRLYTRVAEYA